MDYFCIESDSNLKFVLGGRFKPTAGRFDPTAARRCATRRAHYFLKIINQLIILMVTSPLLVLRVTTILGLDSF